MKTHIQAYDASYSTDYAIVRVQPQGKQSFKPFSFGVSTSYWATNPVSPAPVEREVQRLALLAIKDLAIKARNANQGEFEFSNSLVDLLASIGPSGRLLRADLEAWAKENFASLTNFLAEARGHDRDTKLASKAQVLADLFHGAAAPKPNWKPNHMDLMLEFFTWTEDQAVTLLGDDSIPARIMNKLEAASAEVITDADAL